MNDKYDKIGDAYYERMERERDWANSPEGKAWSIVARIAGVAIMTVTILGVILVIVVRYLDPDSMITAASTTIAFVVSLAFSILTVFTPFPRRIARKLFAD